MSLSMILLLDGRTFPTLFMEKMIFSSAIFYLLLSFYKDTNTTPIPQVVEKSYICLFGLRSV